MVKKYKRGKPKISRGKTVCLRIRRDKKTGRLFGFSRVRKKRK